MVKNGHSTSRRGALAIALLCCASVGLAVSAPAHAAKVGVAAAVNPDAFSSLSSVPNKQLNIGKSIFYNERIETTAQGLVQVLLVDGSTFTVGPNSNLVIDKFVYDPNKKTGQMVATFSKGSMRFIGGKLSKNAGGVKVNTPDGALAIRGGMFQGNTQRRIYSFLFGHSMTMQGRNGQTQTVYQPGYTLDLSSGRGNVRPTTAEDTNVFMQALSSPATNTASGNGGGSGSQNPNSTAQQSGQQADNIANAASQTISDATTAQIQTQIVEQLARLEKLQADPITMPKVNTPPVVENNDAPTVVKEGGMFSGYSTGLLQTQVGESGTGEPIRLGLGSSSVTLDAKANSVSAQIQGLGYDTINTKTYRILGVNIEVPVYHGRTDYDLGYSGIGNNAYVSDNKFVALGDNGTTTVNLDETTFVGFRRFKPRFERNNTTFTDVTHLPPPPGQPPAGFISVDQELCSDCDYMRFGTWGADISYGNGSVTDKMGGWWIASSAAPISSSDMPTQGDAHYEGTAVGTLALKNKDWQPITASGDMTMDWFFEHRAGWLEVKRFGGTNTPKKSFQGPMVAPGRVDFGGPLVGNGLAAGFANGSFVDSRGTGQVPVGVMGSFDVGNKNWKANGVFGGQHIGPVPKNNVSAILNNIR